MSALEQGTLFPKELVTEMFSKVKGHSTLAKMAGQEAIPFAGKDYFTFSLDSDVSIVGESAAKPAGDASVTPVTVKPIKVVYQSRVSSVGEQAFDGCDNLYDTQTIPRVKLVDGWVVGTTGPLLGNLDLTGVRGIGKSAFSNCNGLANVTIGDSVTNIGASAFDGCSGLTGVTFASTIPPSGISNSNIISTGDVKVWYPRQSADLYIEVIPASNFGGYIYLTLGDYVDLFSGQLSTGESHPWQGDQDVSHDGFESLRSGIITHNEDSWVETTVYGAGLLSFWWKVSSERYDDYIFDYAYLTVDGVPLGGVDGEDRLWGIAIGGDVDWTNIVYVRRQNREVGRQETRARARRERLRMG